MFAHHRQKIQLLFGVADAILTVVAFETSYAARTHLPLGKLFFLRPQPHLLLILFAAFVSAIVGISERAH